MSKSKRRMILAMFHNDYQYFPSLKDIRDELVQAQIKHVEETASKNWSQHTKFNALKKNYVRKWELLFNFTNLGDLDESLTKSILSNPNHKITKHILYIYSMETFIYTDLNSACREKDRSKIKYFGAFAAALSYIIQFANKNRRKGKLRGQSLLYRGLKMSNKELDFYIPQSNITLVGYTSTSKDFDCALGFAYQNLA